MSKPLELRRVQPEGVLVVFDLRLHELEKNGRRKSRETGVVRAWDHPELE